LVAIPITNDQPGVAARIVWTGVGTMLPVARLSVPRLRASIRQVLADARFRRNAARLQAAIAEADGLRRAVEITETALVTTSPVVRAEGI
jgi:UDP:flavonoid glycosyltransferase YjiC (YdhE family)